MAPISGIAWYSFLILQYTFLKSRVRWRLTSGDYFILYNYSTDCIIITLEPLMISKNARHGRILEIVQRNPLKSQEQLSSILKQEGVEVTQSTLSRDIRELGLVKARGCYRISGQLPSAPPDDRLRRAFEQYVIRTGVSGNIVMLRTSPGNAHSIAVVLDAAQWPEVLGTVAGDDTVFMLLRNGRLGKKVLGRIRELSE